MSIYVKGSILKQEDDMAVVQLTEEELGKAVLNYVVNNAGSGLGVKFMHKLFSEDNSTDVIDLILSKKNSKSDLEVKKKDKLYIEDEKESMWNSSYVDKDVDGENVSRVFYTKEEAEDIISELKVKEDVSIAVVSLKELAPTLFYKIIDDRFSGNSKLVADYDIRFSFDDECVRYSFVCMKSNNKESVIAPNNNVVCYWDNAEDEELSELKYL